MPGDSKTLARSIYVIGSVHCSHIHRSLARNSILQALLLVDSPNSPTSSQHDPLSLGDPLACCCLRLYELCSTHTIKLELSKHWWRAAMQHNQNKSYVATTSSWKASMKECQSVSRLHKLLTLWLGQPVSTGRFYYDAHAQQAVSRTRISLSLAR